MKYWPLPPVLFPTQQRVIGKCAGRERGFLYDFSPGSGTGENVHLGLSSSKLFLNASKGTSRSNRGSLVSHSVKSQRQESRLQVPVSMA